MCDSRISYIELCFPELIPRSTYSRCGYRFSALVIVPQYPWHPPTHTHTADLEQAEENYEKAKKELETTLAELGDL